MAASYPPSFYESLAASSLSSAREVVPLLLEMLPVRSVVDVGSGTGAWLSVFREHGLDDVFGVDTDDVPEKRLQIPSHRFRRADLRNPLFLDRTFELAISLEVAEHLPAAAADLFVESLVRLSSLVVFSAAVPLQGGYRHLNEQWPDYWVEKFERHGYALRDVIRPKIWTNPRVAWWYSQNMLLFVRRDALSLYPRLEGTGRECPSRMLNVVHPGRHATLPVLRSPAHVLRRAGGRILAALRRR